jgi:hypothetical protein
MLPHIIPHTLLT